MSQVWRSVGWSRDRRSNESSFTAVGRLYRCPRMPGQRSAPSPVPTRYLHVPRRSMLHTRARSASAETPESCGTATSAATTPSSPMCAAPPSPHMGARPPHTTITRKAHHSNKKHPPPHKVPSHQKQPHPPRPASRSVRWARHRSSPPGIRRSRPDSGQTV